ncbi:hypothetical protein ACFQ0M_03035 [Kitasatospora aburaviensis]
MQQGPAVARAATAARDQHPVGATEGAGADVGAAAAGAAPAVRTAAARTVAVAAGAGELAVPRAAGDAGGPQRDLQGLTGDDGQGRPGLAAEAAGRAGVRRVGETKPAAPPPSAPNRSTVTAVTPSGTVKVSVPVVV